MEIQGKIIAALEPRSGVSQRTGTNWMSQDFVIETHEQYPRKCCFSIFGEDKLRQFNIQVGEELTVSFDIDAHEYQGRWFNSIRAWKVERTPAQAGPAVGPTPTADPFAAAPAAPASFAADDNGVNDLPF